jgi:RimJ/RimL family protein N-acetyltransferase
MTRYPSQYGYYEFNTFPGCAQLIVSNHAFIQPDKRGKGFGQEQQRVKLDMAAELGYNCIICTVQASNKVEKHILAKNNWKYCHTFYNTATQCSIEIWVRNV